MRHLKVPVAREKQSPRKAYGNLGDVDTSSDSSTPSRATSFSFRTPGTDDATDYGLEFTRSNIKPRYSSTLRKRTSRERNAAAKKSESEDEETASESESENATTSRLGNISKNAQHKSNRQTLVLRPPQQQKPNPPAPKQNKRKQTNPMHRQEVEHQKFQKEVRHLQNTDKFLIPRLPFSRIVRELMQDASADIERITSSALEALQTASEMYLTQRLQDAFLLTLHRGRVTLEVRDLNLINFLRSCVQR